MWVPAVGVGGARPGHDHPRLFGLGHDRLGAAVQRVKGDEVAPLRGGPGADPQAAQLALQGVDHDLKFGAEDVRVQPHMLHKAVDVPEEPHMAQLVDLVVADGLDGQLGLDVLHIVGRGGDGR